MKNSSPKPQILVCNCGSSSVKIDVFEIENPASQKAPAFVFSALGSRIGSKECQIRLEAPNSREGIALDLPEASHEEAISALVELFSKHGFFPKENRFAVGHRVVHGAHYVDRPILLDENNKEIIKKCFGFAPLHNPANLKGIEACERLFGLPQVGVFDTAFHRSLPESVANYALPKALVQKYHIRRYGFHGTSHEYVGRRAAAMLGRPFSELRIISLHLGNGASACAIRHGRSVNTSMGFTPLEGLVMGTRSGDLDPALLGLIAEKEGLDFSGIDRLLNKESGLKGLAGVSDMRDILAKARTGDKDAMLARDVFVQRVRKYLGAYLADLNGADAVVFTGGIGENAIEIRQLILSDLTNLGILLDHSKNASSSRQEREITAPNSQIRAFVIPTDEEAMIAQKTREVLAST